MDSTENLIKPSIELRERAARCLELSRSNLPRDDVAFLKALAAALIQDAERTEAAETARLAGQYSGSHWADWLARRKTNMPTGLDTSTDRRRPERQDDVSPALIPLLREETIESLSFEPADESFDNLSGSRGIIIWVLVSAATWLSLGLWVGLGG
jgi:hypothetical protein